MNTLKKFAKYALWLIICYILVNVLSYAFIAKSYNKLDNYTILVNTPKIEIIESKATKANGYIIGSVKNNTGKVLNKEYIRINFYNNNSTYIGTEYVELNDIQENASKDFKLSYKYNNVACFSIDTTDEKAENQATRSYTYVYSPEFIGIIKVLGFFTFLWYILP